MSLRGLIVSLLCSMSVASQAKTIDQEIKAHQYQKIVDNSRAFVATLNSQQKSKLQLPTTSIYRTRAFCYVLKHCDDFRGLLLYELDAHQKIALNRLLMYLMSTMGYRKVVAVMNRQTLLNEMETTQRRYPFYLKLKGPTAADLKAGASTDFTPPPGRSLLEYNVVIFGDIDSSHWAIRYEGHHLSINFSFAKKGQRITISPWPIFFGASPMVVPKSPSFAKENLAFWRRDEGDATLWGQALKARDFIQSLSHSQQDASHWGEEPPAILFGGTKKRPASTLLTKSPGHYLKASKLSSVSRYLLKAYLKEYLGAINEALIPKTTLEELISHARVSWWSQELSAPFRPLYLRVVSGDYLIEFSQSDGYGVVSPDYPATHIHSAFRNLKSDWDIDVIKEHELVHPH